MNEKRMHYLLDKKYNAFFRQHEVKFFRKKVDFVYFDADQRIQAIELKIKDWRKALNQVDVNQLFAHFSLLGIWHKYIDNIPFDLFKKYGFGLLSISSKKIEVVIPPEESKIRNREFTDEIKKTIVDGAYGLHF